MTGGAPCLPLPCTGQSRDRYGRSVALVSPCPREITPHSACELKRAAGQIVICRHPSTSPPMRVIVITVLAAVVASAFAQQYPGCLSNAECQATGDTVRALFPWPRMVVPGRSPCRRDVATGDASPSHGLPPTELSFIVLFFRARTVSQTTTVTALGRRKPEGGVTLSRAARRYTPQCSRSFARQP